MPVANLPARLLLNAGGRFLGETLRFRNNSGWFSSSEGPNQTQTFHFFDEGGLQIQSVPHQHVQETAAPNCPTRSWSRARAQDTSASPFLLKADPKGMGKICTD